MLVIATRDFFNNRPRQIKLDGASAVTGYKEISPTKGEAVIGKIPEFHPKTVPAGAIFSIGGKDASGVETKQSNMDNDDNDLLMRLKDSGNIEMAQDQDGKPTVHIDRVAKEVARNTRIKALNSLKIPTTAELFAKLADLQAQIKALIPAKA